MKCEKLTHINDEGRAKMVDVSSKQATFREAIAFGSIFMKKDTLLRIINGGIKKGDVLSVAQVAGIMASKNTPNLIPMCHSLNLSGCDISFFIDKENNKIDIKSICRTSGQTGVEIEAITAVSIAALTIYDMCKAIDREMIISDIKLLKKSGGKSGVFMRDTTI